MSDSDDSDLFPSNMYTFPQESSTISAKGPHINKTLTNSNFRSNMSSTMLMPMNLGRQQFCEPNYYQNTTHNRREVSPMSLRSVPSMHRSNYNESYSQRNNYAQRSIINGRGASPMSVRSIDSNVSVVSAVDIAMAFKNTKYNKNEVKIIREAYHNFMKSRSRRRIEKRRNKRFRCQRRLSHDSEDQASKSSETSDDCRSIKTTTYRHNVSSSRSTRTDLSYLKQSLKESNMYKDCSNNFRQNIMKNTFTTGPRSINGNIYLNTRDDQRQFKAPRSVCSESYIRNSTVPLLKDRFKGSHNFLLPSQRFNSSVASKTILENTSSRKFIQNEHPFPTNKMPSEHKKGSYQTDSDEDVIHTQKNTKHATNEALTAHIKRPLDTNEYIPNIKQFKAPRSVCSESYIRNTSVPVQIHRFKGSHNFLLPSQRFNSSVASKTIMENTSSRKFIQNEHPFPTNKMPSEQKQVSYQTDSDEDVIHPQHTQKNTRHVTNKALTAQIKRPLDTDEDIPNSKKRNKNMSPKKTETQVQNTLSPAKPNKDFDFVKPTFPIKKPLNRKTKETLISESALPTMIQEETENISEQNVINDKQNETQNISTDVSMRPSFIKRKLFSQKLDVTEATDIAPDSPQVNSYTGLLKEKSKARKVVANQSCLSRDTTVNSNLLDLIHKIVPPERMNMTNQTNFTNASVSTKINETHKDLLENEDKWDVTSFVSTCNNSNVSDTFTDEEIFSFKPPKDKKQTNIEPNVDIKSNKTKTAEPTNAAKKQNEKFKNIASKKDVVCKVVMEKVSNDKVKVIPTKNKANEFNIVINNYVDNFLETDYETDSESKRKHDRAAAARNMKVVINKPTTKPAPQSKTPLQKKSAVKKLTPVPVPNTIEVKKRPGLKNYFQRILKGKNKENVAYQEPSAVDVTHVNVAKKDIKECNNNNNFVEKVNQNQDMVKKANKQTKNSKEDEVNGVVNKKTVQKKAEDQSIVKNTKSRRVGTPKIKNLTLNNLNDKLNQPKQDKTLKDKSTTKTKTSIEQLETSVVMKSKLRPRKVDTSIISDKLNNAKDDSLSFNNTMSLRVRKIHDKNENTKEKSKREKTNIDLYKNKKTADNILNTSMTLRVRRQPVKNTSYVY